MGSTRQERWFDESTTTTGEGEAEAGQAEACVTGFWLDDAQVASEVAEKFWADIPGIFVQIWPLNSIEQEET